MDQSERGKGLFHLNTNINEVDVAYFTEQLFDMSSSNPETAIFV